LKEINEKKNGQSIIQHGHSKRYRMCYSG